MSGPTGPISGHPAIPAGTSLQDVVAIVTVHDPSAPWINTHSPSPKTDHVIGRNVSGVNVFLTHVPNQPCYRFGRAMATRTARQRSQEVYLPSSKAAMQQFTMMPDWDRNCWRIQSMSEIITHVNGAPIQSDTSNTKKLPDRLPTTVFLKQGSANEIVVKGCRIEIWLLKFVREVFGALDYQPPRLDARLQNVADRPEAWAVNRYMETPKVISAKTVRVYDSFTGETKAAKIFRIANHAIQRRDREFVAFAKLDVDASIVRYQQSALVNNLPAIIMDEHVGYVSYGPLRNAIHKSHPGIRFSIASRLMLRLFPALAWMHYHGIIHQSVSHDNVLLQLVDGKVEHILLTDYRAARPYIPAMTAPVKDMLADGKALMTLIEDCCDIWTFRNGPTAKAEGEFKLEQCTLEAMRLHEMVKRCSADFIRRGGRQDSLKGIRLNRLQNKTGNAWSSAQAAQQENLLRKEVAHLSRSKIDAQIKEWESANPAQDAVYKDYMILTLGHEVLDNLANQLHVAPWDTMPQEVCAAIKRAGGANELPWDTFAVQKTIRIASTDAPAVAARKVVMAWLATCCEVYPEWCEILKAESEMHTSLNAGSITQDELHNLRNAVQIHGQLPATVISMFHRFADMTEVPLQLEEIYQVWYHIPSRMFNLTQLQRLANPYRLAETITEGLTRYEDFVEVRGDPQVEGCYAPLSLLAEFAEQLGLRLPRSPDAPSDMPTFDPADFSQVPSTRIVLARPGMLGFGTMLRTADQANFLYSRNNLSYVTPHAFIHTYFGDMKVLPKLPPGLHSHARPEHWSKYKTADEFEAAADLSKRARLQATGPGPSTPRSGRTPLQILPKTMEVDETALGKLLQTRERVRNDARLPPKRAGPDASEPSPKRARGRSSSPPPKAKVPDISVSFVQRMDDAMQRGPGVTLARLEDTSFMNSSFAQRDTAILETPPDDPTNVHTSFTVRADEEGLEDDWKMVDQMMAQMPDNEDEHVAGVFGFQFNGDEDEDEDADASEETTEVDSNSFRAPSKSSTPKAKNPTQSFLDRRVSSRSKSRSPTERGNRAPRHLLSAPSQPFGSFGKDMFKQHQRTISGSSAFSDDLPPTEPSSPTGLVQKALPPVTTGLFGNTNVSVFGSFSGFGNTSGSGAVTEDVDMLTPPVTVDQDTSSSKPVNPPVNPFAPPRPSRLGPNATRSFGGNGAQASSPTSQPRASTLSPDRSSSNRLLMNPNASFGGLVSGSQTPVPPARRSDLSGNIPPAARTNSPSALFSIQEEPARQDQDGDSDMPDTDSE
jgi:hypothetical protein